MVMEDTGPFLQVVLHKSLKSGSISRLRLINSSFDHLRYLSHFMFSDADVPPSLIPCMFPCSALTAINP